MKRFLTLIKREMKLFFGNKIAPTLYLGGPILYAVLFGVVYVKGKLNDLPIVVVDKDHTPLSRQLTEMLSEQDVLTVKAVRQEAVGLDKLFMQDSIYGVVEIPYRFEADVLQGRHPELVTYIDNTNILASGYVNRGIAATVATLNAIEGAKTGRPAEAFHLNTFRLFNPSSNYFLYIWPAYLAIILQAVVVVVLALSFASEKENQKTGELVQLAGGSALRILLAKGSFYWLISIVLLLVYKLYFHLFRAIRPPDPLPVYLISIIFILSNSFLGMVAGMAFRSQLKSLQFLMVLSTPIFIASGFVWPYDQNGSLAVVFSLIFPFTPFVQGARILLMEHGSLGDIALQIKVQCAQLGVYFVVAYILCRRWMKG